MFDSRSHRWGQRLLPTLSLQPFSLHDDGVVPQVRRSEPPAWAFLEQAETLASFDRLKDSLAAVAEVFRDVLLRLDAVRVVRSSRELVYEVSDHVLEYRQSEFLSSFVEDDGIAESVPVLVCRLLIRRSSVRATLEAATDFSDAFGIIPWLVHVRCGLQRLT